MIKLRPAIPLQIQGLANDHTLKPITFKLQVFIDDLQPIAYYFYCFLTLTIGLSPFINKALNIP